ncbi:MurJ-like flippase [Pseudobythopirellula maris]|uniref:MurJ-like flippase n=1 Tax=Pseudobythopirellula maris TaxID=2527991 RepID=A0A5C5ZR43_9BACT|nr:MurJ-like flippase [Pseudobythopirellula maris]
MVLMVTVVQRTVGFGRGVLFCRWLDPEELGHWEMAYGFLLLAAPVAVLGLPGSFGRYLDRYRQRGQLRLFLWRTGLWTTLLATSAIGVLVWRRDLVARVVFGDSSQTGLALAAIACLAVVILHHFLEAVFSGLRLFRVVSAQQFAHSMTFAALALTLLSFWSPSAVGVVAGYAGGCLVASVGVLAWSAWRFRDGDDVAQAIAAERPSQRDFWSPLMRFAIWIWVSNLLTNLFAIVDRYMILHCGRFTPTEALEQVGHYHTSMIVPALLISIANLLVGTLTPHFSHDWESGRRRAVGVQLSTTIRLASAAMIAAGCGVLLVCPTLFRLAFEGKYDTGLAVLPWTVTACVWFALLLVAQTYLWCAEKSRRAALPLAIGLTTNVALNLALLPAWGLKGAVAATAISTLIALLAQLEVNRRCGMPLGRTTLLMVLAPALLVLGADGAIAAGSIVLSVAALRGVLLSPRQTKRLTTAIQNRLGRLWPTASLTHSHARTTH